MSQGNADTAKGNKQVLASYKSVKTSDFEAPPGSVKSMGARIGGLSASSKVIKADHTIVTAYNPHSIPIGTESHKFENEIAL